MSSGRKGRPFWHQMMPIVALLLAVNQSCFAYIPGVNHRTIAGLWKLVQKKKSTKIQQQLPLKEFTVYPKDKNRNQKSSAGVEEDTGETGGDEILLMLKEDGSFQQYAADDEPDNKVTIPDKLTFHKEDDAVLDQFFGRIQGQWDYVDGKLILAADRPENNPKLEDTLLVGEVVAKQEESLVDNPIVQNTTNLATPSKFDTHLSVPKGKVNVGKFFYPKQHPSFFEQPMFSPTTKGKFELKQVLGSLNAQNPEDEEELIEKFRQKDFHGKRFLLTSHPLGRHRPKGNTRWSIKYNRYVEDQPSKKAKKEAEEEENRPVNIRVMEVEFFANNTFATIGGLGESILRGKYHIVGRDRDQLWMQVWRFGFGRSVSGSVYSEGKSLTKEDEKTYWGKISFEDEQDDGTDDASPELISDDRDDNENRRLLVKGSVIYGYGLEPQPVGRFVMTETSSNEQGIGKEEDDDDEDDDDDGDDGFEKIKKLIIDDDSNDNDDDFSSWANAFQ